MPADCCYLGGHTALVRLKTGRKMYVDTRDTTVAPHLLLDGEWEKWVTEIVWRNLRAGDTFVDVGAHLGWYTLLGAERVGPRGCVVAFEPNLELVSLLERSLRINGMSNVELRRLAASSHEGSLQFRTHPELSGWGHVSSDEVPAAKHKACIYSSSVPASTLTVHLATYERVHLIKIDAEHHEMAILNGARELIERCKPMLIIEHHPDAADDEIVWLLARGYSLAAIEHDSTLVKLDLEGLSRVIDCEMLMLTPPKAP